MMISVRCTALVWLLWCGWPLTVTAQNAAEKPLATTQDDWTMFRGDAQSRGVATSRLPAQLQLLWKLQIDDDGFEGTAAVVDGVVYIASLNGVLFALDLADGTERWRMPTELGFGTSPSYRDGRVYLGDYDGKFYCVDAASGQVVWTYQADAEINSCANFYKDRVLFGSQDAALYCLDAGSGELVWKHEINDQIRCTPSIVENRAFIAGCDARAAHH